MVWNHRVMRRVQVDPRGETLVTYGIVEAHYEKRGGLPHSWTEGYMEPMGESMTELIQDFACMLAALRLPVLDHNGSECEPAVLLADDIQKWIDAMRDIQGEA